MMTHWLRKILLGKHNLLIMLSFLLHGCFINLEPPDGDYGVGTVTLALEDQSREEVMTKDPSDHRQFLLQFWYPTTPHHMTVLGRYLDLVPKLVHSVPDVPLIETPEPLPLVIMSHGLGGNANHSEFISESLASHGYLVAGIDHTYYGGPVRFPDGTVHSSILNMLRFTGPRVTDELLAAYFDTWVEDCHLVIDAIQRLNEDPASRWYQRIDTRRIAMVSHSFGGAMGMQCATENAAISATITMDGALRGSVKEQGTTTPFMMIWPGDENNAVDHRFDDPAYENSGTFYWASIQNAEHGDFADHNRLLNPGGSPSIGRKQGIVLDLIHAFLQQHLLSEPSTLLSGEGLEQYPEMKFGAGLPVGVR